MSLTVSAASGPSSAPIPEGTYMGVCYMMVDLGEVYSEVWKKSQPKVMIGWEIPDVTITIDGEEKPRVISNKYTASLNEKSRLRKDLISWRGKDFTPAELDRFNLANIIGTSCLLNIIHKEYNGKTYASVSNIVALPKGMPKGQLTMEPVVFDFDKNSLDDIDKLPNWLATQVRNSKTFLDKIAPPAEQEFTEESGDDSDLPF